MKNITRHTGILTITERLNNSYNGNPRYRATVDGYTFTTRTDSMTGYSITGYDGKLVEVEIGTHYGSLQLAEIRKQSI
jgi:hypothetical protein